MQLIRCDNCKKEVDERGTPEEYQEIRLTIGLGTPQCFIRIWHWCDTCCEARGLMQVGCGDARRFAVDGVKTFTDRVNELLDELVGLVAEKLGEG